MKINKKIFISVLLVLVILGVMGTVSAADSLNNNLTAENTDAVSADVGDNLLTSADDNLLGDGETTIYVDSSYDGDEQGTEDNPYKTISTAVSNANGGETIFIKNGEYTESPIKDIAIQLTFQGESQDGVIIKFDSTGFFSSTKSGYGSFVFKDLTFKDSSCTGANMAINIGGNGDVYITDCTFDNVSGRYGAIRIFTSGNVLVDNCKFINTKSSSGSYSSAIDFGGSSDTTYTLSNTIIDNSTISSVSTASYIFGVIYVEKSSGTVIIDNVNITNCNITASGLISAKGNVEVRNSKFANNWVYRDNPTAGLFFVNGAKSFTLETSILVNNSQPNYILSSNSPSSNYAVNYNNIQNNTFALNATNPNYGIYDLDYNYWGSNDGPADVNANVNNWAIDNNGVFTLNDGSPLAKEIPRIGDAPIGDENSTWVSTTGDDSNTGSSDSPVATIAKAVELAKNRTGEIFIEEGTYIENNIVLDGNVTWSITGIGNVVIDGNASSNSIFILHNDATVAFSNIRFTNNKAKYGGAIFVNSGTGTGRTVLDVDITVDNCIFDNMESSSRGAGIYLWYTKGNLIVTDSQFINSTAGSWGGAICVGQSALSDGLNVEISGSTFENCSANNGGACYLQANTLTVTDSVFNHNNASYDSAAMQIYNSTASIDNCIITNNQGGSQGVAIKETMPSKVTPRVLTITNSVIENNTGRESTLPAIYVDMTTLDVSYSSLVNDLSVETRTATGYDAIYGQGIATLNNNWWGTNDPSTKVTGTNITMDNWVIMNVEANATEAIIGDKVTLTIDFNHVNTTAGEIEELTGGVIPKTHKVQLSSNSGTFVPASLTIKDGAVKSSTYTVGDINDIVSVVSEEAVVEMSFAPEIPPYYGIIYVSKDGDDNNNGSESAPVATIAKAIELASIVGGSGQIIVNEGTYNGTDYLITTDLTITGVGDVIFDAEGKSRFFYLPSDNSIDKFELNNIALINSAGNPEVTSGYYGTIMYNYAASEVILNNVTIRNNDADISTLISTNGYNLVINNSRICDNVADKLIAVSGKYDSLEKFVTIVNTTFENNAAPQYRIIEAGTSSGSLTLNLTDSHFIGNTGKLGIVQADTKTTVNVIGTEFISNTNNVSSGGAIDAATLNVVNSTFIDNKAARDAGAIYINRNGGGAVITGSTFINNAAGEKGSAINNKNKLTINYSVLLSNTTGYVIYHDGDDNVMDANYNWWGTNDDPSALIGLGTYEDDWGDDVPCEYDASKWVVMNVNNNLTSETLDIGNQIEFTVDFNHFTDSTADIHELEKSIPEVGVSASALNGEMDKDKVTTEGNVATFVYTATAAGEDTITIASSNAANLTTVNVKGPSVIEVIYVAVEGSDDNNGSYDAPVATIAHAIDIAENGKIVILAGEYTINATLIIDKDLNITGEGNVVINGNLNRIIENTANLNLTNIVFTNAKMGFGSVILDDGNVTIDNCTFYSNTATASTSGNIINNRKGNMFINNSKFYDNVASRGAVASQSATNLVVNNSEFYNNDMSLSGSSSYYGIIYSSSADTIVENCVFRNNKAKQGAGIWATRATSAATGSLEIINCTFENNVAEVGTGGAIFASGKVTVDVYNSTFINNTAVKSDSGVGGNGGAIYSTGTTDISVTDSVFIDNAGDADAGIYAAGNSFDIINSVILARDGDTNPALNGAGATVNANDNFWGDNSKANTNEKVQRWVIMSATYDDETGALDITFDKTNSTDGTIADYDDVLPDGFNVSVSSSSGALDETLPVISGQTSTTYVPSETDTIIVKSGNAEVIIQVIIEPKVIYVAVDGNDDNTGSIDDPVATIAHAIEIATDGKIVILEGTYTTGYLGLISNDLNITGNGTVIIDAQNNNRILYVGEEANVVLENLIMINGCDSEESGALIGNANCLTLINCTLANSSAGEHNGGAIYNVGKLTIINSTIANNTAKLGGAIFTNDALAVGPEITIINSTFENNIANGNDNSGGGAIFAQQLAGLTIINTTFIGNEALTTSSGGAIFISHSDAQYTIADSKFIQNHANGKDGTGGGAIYMAGTSNYERKGKLSISNTLFEENTADTNGAAIYARATTVDVTNSVIFANKDPAGFSVYGYKTEQVAPAITLNDNWWGTNDDPNDYVGGYNYDPTISRWVILTATNDTPFVEGETVKITVSLDQYTDGSENGTLATPITIPRDVFIDTTFDPIEGVLENGVFTVDYVVPADLKYVAANVDAETVELYHVKTATVVEIDDITAIKGDSVVINATVKTVDGDNVTGGYVEVYFGDDLVANMSVVDGVASEKVEITKDAGVYNITAKFIDLSGELLDSEANATLEVVLIETAISAVYDDDKELTVTLVDNVTGEPIGDVDVVIVIGDDNYTVTTNASGEAVQSLADLVAGPYTATVSFNGTDVYAASSIDVDFIVKADTVVSAVYDDIAKELTVTLVDNVTGEPIGDADVVIVIGDDNYTVTTGDNGQAIQSLADLGAGPYTATVSYDGSADYNPSSVDVEFIVKADTVVSAVYDDDAKELIVTLVDNVTGEPIGDADVVIVIGDDNYTVTTDDDGQAIQPLVDLTPGPYTATVSYDGGADYNPSSVDVEFIVKADTVVSAVYDDDAKELTVTLINEVTGEPIGDADVLVTIGDNDYSIKTDSNGQAVSSTADLPLGAYIATISYDGNEEYNPSSTTLSISVKVNTTISAVYDDSIKELTVTLVNNATGAPMKGASVAISVGGENYTAKINGGGKAFISLADLAPGTYTADISYNGGAKCNPSSTSLNIVTKANSRISAVYDDIAKELTVTLVNDATGAPLKGATVAVSVGGENYTAKINGGGKGIISLADLATGTYTADISYNGGAKCNPTSTSLTIVSKINANLSAVYDDIAKELTVTLVNDATGAPLKGATIVVNVGGENYTAKISGGGKAVISLADLALGTYDVTVSYNGGAKCNPANTNLNIIVKANANLSGVYNDATKELTVRLVNGINGAPMKGATVVVNVGGAEYSTSINSAGKGIISLADLAPGTYDAILAYNGGTKCNPANATVEVIIDEN